MLKLIKFMLSLDFSALALTRIIKVNKNRNIAKIKIPFKVLLTTFISLLRIIFSMAKKSYPHTAILEIMEENPKLSSLRMNRIASRSRNHSSL